MPTIPIGGKVAAGRVALVDDHWYDWLCTFRWHGNAPGRRIYATAYVPLSVRSEPYVTSKCVMMHRIVAGWTRGCGMEVDHINGDTLDNRADNLRLVTRSQNMQNVPRRSATSQYKGVCWCGRTRRWEAQITVKRQNHGLGHWGSEVDAALAYDRAAVLYFGDGARVNFPELDMARQEVAR